MTGGHRTACGWCSLAPIATALTAQRIAAADQPVHEVQIVASRYTFERGIHLPAARSHM
jgi:hypothetical protein